MAAAMERTLPFILETVLHDKLATALHETISPTLKNVLEDKISESFVSIMDDSFSGFTTKMESLGTEMFETVWRSVAAAEGPLLDRYAAVTADYSACKARLDEVVALLSTRLSDMPAAASPAPHTPPDNPGGEATVPSSSSPSAQAATAPSDTLPGGGVTRHPLFPQGPLEDFDFSYRGNNRPDASPRAGGNARVPPLGGMSAVLPRTLTHAMTRFWVVGLPLLASRTVPVWPAPRT
jgi:hypothetical protein